MHRRFVGVIPVRLLETFIHADAETRLDEIASRVIYLRRTGELRLHVYDALQALQDGIAYRLPQLSEVVSIGIVLHSHGRSRSFRSPIDDSDERGLPAGDQ